jgi:hypothetical protein
MFATSDRKRFFHLPDDAALAAGAFEIRNLKGERRAVDEAAVAPFEVDEAQAKALVRDELARFARKTQDFLAGAAAALRGAAPLPPATGASEGPRLADLLGLTPEELRADPKRALAAVNDTLRGWVRSVKDTAEVPPGDVDARARVERLSAALAAQGTEFAGTVEQLPERLARFVGDPALEGQIRDAARDLREAAATLRGRSEG